MKIINIMNFFVEFIQLILSPYVWVPVCLILGGLAVWNNRKIKQIQTVESTLLILEIPKTNDKSELAAEQLFASLHGILRDAEELKRAGGVQEHLSFEIASVGGQIRFYVWTPTTLQSFVEGQIYAQYPTVQIHEADEDYVAHERHHSVVHTAEITLTDSEFLPLKTFQSFEVDPLAGITGTLAKLEDTGEELWIQVLVRPVPDSWHKNSNAWISKVKNGGGFSISSGFDMKWLGTLAEALVKPPETGAGGEAKPKELSERDKTRIAEAEKKATKLGYQVKIRLAYLGESQANAKLRMQALVGTYKQYNSTNLNGFKQSNSSMDKDSLGAYRSRVFMGGDGFVLNIEELASVFHLPHTNVETPNIVWASTKTAEPPAKLPVITGNEAIDENISAFGLTNFRGINHQFGMLRYDRSRHVYIIGQTGAGKSGLLELFALSDVYHNQGYAIIDPHGDFAINNMKFIPAHRIKDVVYFNPADTAHPVGFNPLEVTDPNMKSNISSEVIGVLKRMFGESWGPRLEYILRYTILALLDRPETTMLDITRMLTDKKFRKETLDYCTDTVVLQFWKVEFASWNDKFVAEAIAPVLNKVGAFTANPVIRNIIGQPKSTFNIREIMDDGKILVVNLSKGLIGEDNAGILGSFLVTKIQLAAMSRSDIPNVEDRRPFYLYVDEFQNFATDSFATILSEARKYGLNLTVANQYISQMSDTVRGAVFGNVGTMISFRVSAEDAQILAQQFQPQFEANDLLQMHNRHFIVNMVIKGEKAPAFSATTLNLPPPQVDNSAYIIQNSREQFSLPRAEVEQAISDLIQPPEQLKKPKATPTTPVPDTKQWPINAQTQMITPDSATPPPVPAETVPPAPTAPPVASVADDGTLQIRHDRKKKPTAATQQPAVTSSPAPAQTEEGSRDAPKKRKRKRTRKKKPATPTES
ncbi:type IV secretion system DNA-binding domain-containing protein [Candidatus Mycosynbacter amalyticus]|uniref:Type IV secretion system DNA-binding domain-containing protein n=2 Tax=Candidatus Mycosynbacter amalyticus TaxID=2665156 RepID=A0A857MT36_9BACT|nr:type IV secretion system DNA-binding domain-containing protein [Candidatus Mycosynbacter amalyticus]